MQPTSVIGVLSATPACPMACAVAWPFDCANATAHESTAVPATVHACRILIRPPSDAVVRGLKLQAEADAQTDGAGETSDCINQGSEPTAGRREASMATRTEARLGYVPHFDVITLGGQRVRYREIWQRRHLVLVIVSPREREAAALYASLLEARRNEFEEGETTVVVTADVVPGLSAPRVVIADRWGEILH